MDEWKPRTEVVVGEIPHYTNPDQFTVKIFHGGRIKDNNYVGGSIDYYDNCDKDMMSLTEVHAMVRSLKHSGRIDYWYSIRSEDDALTKLSCDTDVTDMCSFVPDFRLIIMYLDHLDLHEHDQVDEVFIHDSFVFSRAGSSGVVIEELLEEPKNKPAIVLKDLECHDVATSQGSKVKLDGATDMYKEKKENNVVDSLKCRGKQKLCDFDGLVDIHVNEFQPNHNTDDEFVDPEFSDDQWGIDDDYIPEVILDNELYGDENWVGTNGEEPSAQKYFFEEDAEFEDNEGMFGAIDSDNEALGPIINSDGEEEDKYPEFNPKTDMKNPVFVKGMKFATAEIFRAAVRERGILDGWEGVFLRSDRTRVRVICKAENCPFEIFASKMQHEDTLQVKTYIPEHSCTRVDVNCMIRAPYLSTRFLDRIKLNPNWEIDSLASTMSADVKAKVSRQMAYRAKKRAEKVLDRSVKEQYERVWDYGQELKRSNPGTTIDINCDYNNPDKLPVFKRMYVCLGACKKGFKDGCRPLIGVDGCHLKSCYGGQLLTAVGLDANNTTWVIAYAMVELESKDAWVWFLELLVKDVNIVNQAAWTFISDKQKGLLPAFEQVIPNADHRFCVRHLWTNFNKLFQGMILKDQLWACAKASTMSYYIKEMILMKNMDPLAYDWLTDPRRPPKHWSRAHFNTHLKCDTLLNNLCESFNSFILPARCKHIVSMMEDIRQKLMKRIQIRRDKMSNYEGIICPKIKEILELNKVKAATDCIARGSGGPLVEIESFSGGQYVVNLERFSCTCRRWDLTGIPCKHGVSAIHFMRKKPEDFVDKCYLKSTYMEIYGNIILPVNGMDLWERYEHPPILPPRYNRQPGRPRTKRIKDASEKEDKSGHKLGRSQRSLRCGNCKEFGHNVKTCQRHLPPKSNKRKRVSKKEASTSANPTQTEATVGLERKLLMRKNFLRKKSKIRAEEAKKKRNAKKASSDKGQHVIRQRLHHLLRHPKLRQLVKPLHQLELLPGSEITPRMSKNSQFSSLS